MAGSALVGETPFGNFARAMETEDASNGSGSRAVGARVIRSLEEARRLNQEIFDEGRNPDFGASGRFKELVASLCDYFNNPAVDAAQRAAAICHLHGLNHESSVINIPSADRWDSVFFDLRTGLAVALRLGYARVINHSNDNMAIVTLELGLPGCINIRLIL
jgi:hypothetical protein